MGSAALYQLAKRGIDVLGIDRYSPPHTLGSTHGETRITRQAIGEGENYTPLSLRSYEIFRELEQETGASLLQITGGLIISSDTAAPIHVPHFFDNTIAAAKRFGIRHELLSATEVRSQFPQFNIKDDERAYFEYEAGFLRPEECIIAQLNLAQELGAEIHINESIKHFEERNNKVYVETDDGSYVADKIILSVGPWLPELIGSQLHSFFKVHRQVLYWFDVSKNLEQFEIGRFPIFIWETQGGFDGLYGFPAIDGIDGGMKIASEDFNNPLSPDTAERTVSQAEIKEMYQHKVLPFVPSVGRNCVRTAVCLYTVTPDSAFVIDWHPDSKRVLLCSPCSGHGFKHSAAIGECVAELLIRGESNINIDAFKLQRLAQPASS